MIYLDHAATSRPKPPCVAQAVTEALDGWGNSGRGAHDDALAAARGIYGLRCDLADFFGCNHPERVVFTPNSTAALNLAIAGLFGPGDHVIATDWEHNSVLRPLYRLRQQGGAVDFLPAGPDGHLNYGQLGALLRPNTKALVCTHASNVTGDVVDLPRMADFARAHGLVLILDASQTAGVFPLHMERMGIHVLCFTGHKSLLGPQGTGGLCAAEGVNIRPMVVGGSGVQSFSETHPADYPTRLEAGTLNGHGLAGLAASLQYIRAEGVDAIRTRELSLARRFYEGVRALAGVRVYGDWSIADRAPIVALNIADWDAAEVADQLDRRFSIAVRAGAHCAPRIHRALGTAEQGIVRFSWGWCTTEADTDAAIRAVETLAREA